MSTSFRAYSVGSSSRWPGNFDGEKIDGSNSVSLGGGVKRRSGDNDDSEDSDKAGDGTLDEGA